MSFFLPILHSISVPLVIPPFAAISQAIHAPVLTSYGVLLFVPHLKAIGATLGVLVFVGTLIDNCRSVSKGGTCVDHVADGSKHDEYPANYACCSANPLHSTHRTSLHWLPDHRYARDCFVPVWSRPTQKF